MAACLASYIIWRDLDDPLRLDAAAYLLPPTLVTQVINLGGTAVAGSGQLSSAAGYLVASAVSIPVAWALSTWWLRRQDIQA